MRKKSPDWNGYTEDAVTAILGPLGGAAHVLIVAAHMDDEAIGTGALLRYLKNFSVLHVTDGSARNMRAARARGFDTRRGYALARAAETREALSLGRSSPADLSILDIPDLDGPFNLAPMAHAVKEHILKTGPSTVISHPYEGGHPDHDSAAFAVSAARFLIAKQGGRPPEALEFTSYHVEGGKMATSAFLPSSLEETVIELSEEERARKEEMFRCYRTQKGALKNFPVGVEKFRKAPRYDFCRPPHEGRLFYQYFDWGLPGRRWCALAAKASKELGVGEGRAERDYLAEMSPRALYRYLKYLRTRSAFF